MLCYNITSPARPGKCCAATTPAPILSYKIGWCQAVLQKIFSMSGCESIEKYNSPNSRMGPFSDILRSMNPLLKPWHEACKIWPELLDCKTPTFKISERLTKTAGLCWVEQGEITLSGPYLRAYRREMMGQILAHETAHYIDYCLNGWHKYKRHHGKPWQEIMYNLGFPADSHHSMEL